MHSNRRHRLFVLFFLILTIMSLLFKPSKHLVITIPYYIKAGQYVTLVKKVNKKVKVKKRRKLNVVEH